MTLRQMEYFVAVAEHGSIVAAAAELPVSESAVSVAISELENIVGVRLLHRVRARGRHAHRGGQLIAPGIAVAGGTWWSLSRCSEDRQDLPGYFDKPSACLTPLSNFVA